MRNYLASFVNLLHVGVLVTSVTGWLWWPQDAILWYVGGMLAIALQWLSLRNHCVLTDLEWWLKHNTRWQAGNSEGFVMALARRLGATWWTPRADRAVPWCVLAGCVVLGCRRMLP